MLYDFHFLSIDAGITYDDMRRIEETKNPTQELLNSWRQGDSATLYNLCLALYNIERNDIISDLEKTLNFTWKSVSCQNNY